MAVAWVPDTRLVGPVWWPNYSCGATRMSRNPLKLRPQFQCDHEPLCHPAHKKATFAQLEHVLLYKIIAPLSWRGKDRKSVG